MRLGILGKKVGMTQIFDDAGMLIPVTVIDASECYVSQVKTKDSDGYAAIQVATGFKKPQNFTKALLGHYKKAGVPARKHSQEIRFQDTADLTQIKAGQQLNPAMFQKGDFVDVQAETIGRGFQGVMKRHNYHGADATHGVHEYYRHGGSIGTNTFPGRTLKNKGMPGHMGDVPRTIKNLEVMDVKPEEKLILLKGSCPGANNAIVLIRTSLKSAKQPEGRSFTA